MDPDLKRLLATPRDRDLTVREVADVLMVHEVTITRAVNRGDIESKRHSGRGQGSRHSIRITREAVLVYIVKICSGDRTALFHSIQTSCPPAWLDLALKTAGLHTLSPAPAPLAISPNQKRPKAAPATDPLAGHCGDLFTPRTIA
ncbi:hypothetical protein GCM10023213_14220 [Prosthecobacter algae]|uniref:Helix-turn-helix domain-containing protein n=1 Tax=Prosthecobacter algae TaxID=1144682 RepID=A0ABP9NZ04_9BACT